MAIKPKNAERPTITYYAIRGSYGKVSYFVTKASLRDVAENLQLAPQEQLNFSERIQRVVNTKRVEQELLPYLQHNELRFFNSLVCILLPDSNQSAGFWEFEDFEDEDGQPLGGLGLLKISKDIGRVVLDGQHRYEALKLYWNSIKDTPDSSPPDIEVSLVFVVVNELGRRGVNTPNLRDRTIQDARNLFAMLNKTARPVDKNTLLLIDDSDIGNVITRRILEDEIIDDRFVKWVGGQNLGQADPQFTVLQVLKDTTIYYLRDFKDQLERDYGSNEERQQAIEELFLNTPKTEVPFNEAARDILTTCQPFKKWQSLLNTSRIHVQKQPDETHLTPAQIKSLEARRSETLGFTVAGQKVLFRAIIDAFYNGKKGNRRDLKHLRKVIARANKLIENGLFARKVEDSNPYSGLLFDKRNRMGWAETVVERARKVFSVALGSDINRESTLQEYRAFTGRSSEVVEQYWEACEQIQ